MTGGQFSILEPAEQTVASLAPVEAAPPEPFAGALRSTQASGWQKIDCVPAGRRQRSRGASEAWALQSGARNAGDGAPPPLALLLPVTKKSGGAGRSQATARFDCPLATFQLHPTLDSSIQGWLASPPHVGFAHVAEHRG